MNATKTIEFRGETIVLKCNMRALYEIERFAGCNAILALRDPGGIPSYTRAAEVLAVLTGKKPEEAFEIVRARGLAPCCVDMIEVIQNFTAPEDIEPGEDKAGPVSTQPPA